MDAVTLSGNFEISNNNKRKKITNVQFFKKILFKLVYFSRHSSCILKRCIENIQKHSNLFLSGLDNECPKKLKYFLLRLEFNQ